MSLHQRLAQTTKLMMSRSSCKQQASHLIVEQTQVVLVVSLVSLTQNIFNQQEIGEETDSSSMVMSLVEHSRITQTESTMTRQKWRFPTLLEQWKMSAVLLVSSKMHTSPLTICSPIIQMSVARTMSVALLAQTAQPTQPQAQSHQSTTATTSRAKSGQLTKMAKSVWQAVS